MPTREKPEQPLSAVETADLRYLDPQTLRFFHHGATLRLTIDNERSILKVGVVRAFPLSDSQRFFSVRDGADKEVGLIVDPSALDDECRRLVVEELERRYVVPVIRRILTVKERFGTVDWEVETDRGACRFTTRNTRESVVNPSPNRFLLTDVEGNRYDVRDLAALDPASQAWLMSHL